ncbi:MAG TPA: serine hydrolase [Candidatus Peribacteraceae bacterium]|nr:serine hydrolase [Candidatus Peribacteraceae bacterium]
MFGPLLSVLLMGMIPVWDLPPIEPLSATLTVAPPAVSSETGDSPHIDLGDNVSASGIMIMDLQSGQVLAERNADVSRPMASLTKLMTALLIVENHSLDEKVKVPMDIDSVPGNDYHHLPAGDTFTVGDLLSAMLIISSNDSAVTLAKYDSGTIAAFAQKMNARAKTLGLKQTSYDNPVGFDAPRQESTPRDLAWLAMYVLKNPEIAKRMSTPSTQIVSAEGHAMSLFHTNELLHEDSFVIAGKTGTTDDAGQCLLSIVEEKGRKYVVVLLHSRDRYGDMNVILPELASL